MPRERPWRHLLTEVFDVLGSQSQNQSLHTLPASILHLLIKAWGWWCLCWAVCVYVGVGGLVTQHTHAPFDPPVLMAGSSVWLNYGSNQGSVYCTQVNDGCWMWNWSDWDAGVDYFTQTFTEIWCIVSVCMLRISGCFCGVLAVKTNVPLGQYIKSIINPQLFASLQLLRKNLFIVSVLKDKAGIILYSYYCQQIPWQHKQCISLSLNTFWLPMAPTPLVPTDNRNLWKQVCTCCLFVYFEGLCTQTGGSNVLWFFMYSIYIYLYI